MKTTINEKEYTLVATTIRWYDTDHNIIAGDAKETKMDSCDCVTIYGRKLSDEEAEAVGGDRWQMLIYTDSGWDGCNDYIKYYRTAHGLRDAAYALVGGDGDGRTKWFVDRDRDELSERQPTVHLGTPLIDWLEPAVPGWYDGPEIACIKYKGDDGHYYTACWDWDEEVDEDQEPDEWENHVDLENPCRIGYTLYCTEYVEEMAVPGMEDMNDLQEVIKFVF